MFPSEDDTIEILPPGASGGEKARRVRDPGWITRHRETLLSARRLGASVVMFAPPQARIPLAAACLAIDGLLLAEEARRGERGRGSLALTGLGLALEGGGLVAAMASAPATLARQAPRLMAARRILARFEAGRGTI